MRNDYEQILLEIRQGIKETEENLKNLACVNLFVFKEVLRHKQMIQKELVSYRSGASVKNRDLLKFLEG